MISKKALIEGVLFGSAHPVKPEALAQVVELEIEEVKNLIGELQEEYASENRGFWLVMVGGAYQLRTKPDLKPVMAKFFEKKPPRLTQAMLEVLSIVAYKQPVTRPEIDRIRGVDSSGALKTLLERELIEMRGRSDGPGNPVLYVTTPKFLEWFQVASLGELPPLSEIEALNVKTDEDAEDLMKFLNREGKLTSEDLRDLDQHLQEVARQQRKIQWDVTTPEEGNAPELTQTEAPQNEEGARSEAEAEVVSQS